MSAKSFCIQHRNINIVVQFIISFTFFLDGDATFTGDAGKNDPSASSSPPSADDGGGGDSNGWAVFGMVAAGGLVLVRA